MKKKAADSGSAEHWDKHLKRELANESDRACVIIAAAVLDSALMTLLKSHLIPVGTREDHLFDGANAPLSTFSARIEMSHRLGLMDANLARSLNLIRRIRNDFAHDVAGCSFEQSRVMNRMTELKRAIPMSDVDFPFRSMFPEGLRGEFELIVSWLQWVIRSLSERIEPVADSYHLSADVEMFERMRDDLKNVS